VSFLGVRGKVAEIEMLRYTFEKGWMKSTETIAGLSRDGYFPLGRRKRGRQGGATICVLGKGGFTKRNFKGEEYMAGLSYPSGKGGVWGRASSIERKTRCTRRKRIGKMRSIREVLLLSSTWIKWKPTDYETSIRGGKPEELNTASRSRCQKRGIGSEANCRRSSAGI